MVIVFIIIASIMCFLFMIAVAPEGWEDENGFHLGCPDRDDCNDSK